ncbi:uncharacterized protein LOC124446594 isoform X2 [Xenia sp. Carnegie-2017]|uniref:uncharacterized protein LOC124446594 isoform X2 n=1 Tax=Xenia sp. Carnegie-2017 TaxID=2897299 RepID=UPI001F04A51F|nr:uncharacterized protein LOC124446594 isoform X2 [Xenia sp. Carnegie-2017]
MTKSLSPCKNLFVKQRRRRFMKQLYLALIVFSFGNLVDAVPKIIDSSENTNTYYGSKITLFCTSEGSPMPNITWSKSRSKIREIPNKIEINTKVLTSVKVKSVLTIKNICEKCNLQKKGETIKYTCQVGKGVAVSRKKISVFINPKPKAPVINSSRVISSSAILIRWKAVKLVSKPVLHYTIHFNADGEKTSSMENISTTNDEIIEYIIENLTQLTTYSIFITATNEFGEGEASELLIEKTNPLEPQPPHMSIDHSTYQNISLRFKPSSKNKRRILEYQIFVEVIDGKTTNQPLPLPKVYGNDSFKSKHNIYAAARFEGNKLPKTFILGDGKWYDYRFNKELQPLEKYRIYVRALAKNYTNKNIVVFGKPFYLTATTKFPKVPKLIVIETSKDWAKFEWRKLKSEKIFYKVIVKDEGGEIQESGKVEKNSLKFKGLKEKKTYKAYLRVCASTKDCKESEGIEFKMDSTSSSPTLIIVIVVGIVAVLVIVIIAVIFFMRRRKKHKQDIIKNNKMDSLLESKAPRNGSLKHLSEDQIALIETKENGHILTKMS